MKKLLLTITAALLFVIGAKSQTADLGLDTWVNDSYGSLQDAQGWTSFNTASYALFGAMPQSVYKITAGQAFGAACAKVVTEKVPNPPLMVPNPMRPGQPNFDTVGLLCLGTIHATPSPGLTFGAPITNNRPVKLTFSSKDSVVAGDTSFVLVYLTKWSLPNHKLDTIASGKWAESSTGSVWASHTITMNYVSGTIVPDSQQIFVSSSIYSHGGAKMGSKYYVDGFCWDCTAGINELNSENAISVFPNPATSEINFTSSLNANFVEVADITGRKVGLFVMQNNKVKIQTESFTPGLYLFTVMNDKKVVISRGKFEVAK